MQNVIYELMQIINKIIEWLKQLLSKLEAHNTFIMASGISFNILLYLFPLILVLMYILTTIFPIEKIIELITILSKELLPATESTNTLVQEVIKEVNTIFNKSSYVGLIGIIILLWISSTLISTIRTALNTVFDLESKRIFFLYRLKDILLVILFAILIVLYSYALPIVNFAHDVLLKFLHPSFHWLIGGAILKTFTLLCGFVLYYLVFSYVPNSKIPRLARFTSIAVCLLAMEISTIGFTWYLSTLADYGKFYGTYAIIVSIAFWIYYSSVIILISAEIGNLVKTNSSK